MHYNSVLKASQEFTEKKHYAPTKIFMSEQFYYDLCNETYCNCQFILMVHRRFLGMEVILDNSVNNFKLE